MMDARRPLGLTEQVKPPKYTIRRLLIGVVENIYKDVVKALNICRSIEGKGTDILIIRVNSVT